MLPRRNLLLIALTASAHLLAQTADHPPSGTFRITGSVKHPGQFNLHQGIRVVDAIAMAGGFVDFANLKKIAVIRDGQRHDFNYRDAIRGKNPEQNILLQDKDVIEVP
jgi:protein involved in polysaccharide export with SLBB domain